MKIRLRGLCASLVLILSLPGLRAQTGTLPTVAGLSGSQTVVEGTAVTLSVSVNGTTPFSYQWRKDGVALAGATANLYSLAPARLGDAGSYTVVIANSAGTVTGGPIVVSVVPATPPRIDYLPGNATYYVGDTIDLGVSMSGSSPFTFEWRRNGTLLASGSNARYVKANAQVADGGSYTVTATNSAGSVTSAPFTVTINPLTAPVIASGPYDTTVNTADSIYLSVSVARMGNSTFSYQWTKDGVALAGATQSSYSKSNAVGADAGAYAVTVTNAIGSTLSTAARVSVRPPTGPTISYIGETRMSISSGGSFQFYANVNGTPPVTFQWFKDGVALAGSTGTSFGRSGVALADAGAYALVATNAQGATTSPPSRVGVLAPRGPVILRAPISQAVNQGDSISFSIEASGTSPLSYQWRKDGAVLAGATGNYVTVSNRAAASDAGAYTVTVSNALGTVVSEPGVVTVRSPVPPVILVPPSGRVLMVGEYLSLGVQADTNRNVTTYQWYKDGVILPNATGDSYSVSGVTAAVAGDYTVTVTNPAGAATSAAARIGVRPVTAPLITQHPASGSLLPGESFGGLTINLQAGAGNATYQWQRDGVAVVGATGPGLYLSGSAVIPGTYRVVVTNAVGSVTSREAVVTVDPSTARPTFIGVPGSRSVPGGSTATLQVALAANLPVQWRKDGVDIPNATRSDYSIAGFGPANVGTYTAVATTPAGPIVSRPILLELLDAGQAPEVLVSPLSQSRSVGESVGFDVSCSGETPLTFQWRKDGNPIPGATGSSYYLGTLAAANAGRYTVTATNRHGATTSTTAVLEVRTGAETAPLITIHPTSVTVLSSNGSVYLNVGLASSVGATYQWRRDGAAIAGATSGSLTLGYTAGVESVGRYAVTVTNPAGAVTSREAVVTFLRTPETPVVATSPATQTAVAGGTVVLEVTATGATRYQWRRNGVDLAGGTAATLTLANVQIGDAGTYVALAANDDGVAPSLPAVLTVQVPTPGLPLVATQPRDQTVLPGNTATFSAGIAASPAATYQWRKDGLPLAGATGLTLTLPNVTVAAAGAYQLVATNSFGSVVTNVARLLLGTPITFAVQPRSQAIAAGTALTLEATVASPGAVTYQWRKDGVAVAGATRATLTFSSVRPEQAGSYTLVVTNADGAVESAPARITVTSSPHAGSYFGSFGTGDTWALHVGTDGTIDFQGVLTPRNQLIIARGVALSPSGAFRFSRTPVNTTGLTPALASRYYEGSVDGTIEGGVVRGLVNEAGVAFTGGRLTAGATAALAGAYTAVPVASELSEVHVLAAPDGTLQLLAALPGGVQSARGQLNPSGSFVVAHPRFSYGGTLVAGRRGFVGSYQPENGAAITLAIPAAAGGIERLANVATRGVAGAGARVLIAGFVISGTAPQDVLIRAAGPALGAFGVSGALGNPRLRLFRGEAALFENDDWSLGGFAPQITAAAIRLGAFPFAAGSGDSALIVRLDPGSYSAQVTTDAASTGVALIEVYDAATTASATTKLANLSTRGEVGTGGDILIVGLVVTGDAPRKLLIRGIGPGLAAFGVAGSLVDPQLRLFRGSELLRENDNWAGTDAALIAEAGAAVGAFALPVGSKDAAVLLYLAPGAYSAQLSGVGGTTGIGLVEAYDVP